MGQANDDLELCKTLIGGTRSSRPNWFEVQHYRTPRRGGFIEILPAQDALRLHGKTYLFVVDELHTQNWRLLEALEIDRTRQDAMQWFASYASIYRQTGVPLNDILRQHAANKDPRLYVSVVRGHD